MIRATHLNSLHINKHKDKYSTLYNEMQTARKEDSYNRNSWVFLSKKAKEEYDNLVKRHLVIKNYPNSNRKVMITTANGGQFVGFYENHRWKYVTGSDEIREVDAPVIQWKKY